MKRFIRLTLISFATFFLIVILVLTGFGITSLIRESHNAKDIAPLTGRFVHTDSGQIFIQEMGPEKGKPILFIHGSLAWSETWKEVMKPLSEQGFRTIALDLPPFGFSERPLAPAYTARDQARRIISLVDKLAIKPILVGHSFGGSPTIEAAIIAPERFSGLILIDVAVDPNGSSNQSPNPIIAEFLKTGVLRNSFISTTLTNPLLTKYLLQKFIYKKETATDKIVNIYQQPLKIRGSTNALGDWLPSLLFPQQGLLNQRSENYQKLSLPTLIIWGDKDSITPLNKGQDLNQLIPNSRLMILNGVGHIPQIEDVGQLNHALERGLAKLNL